MSALARLQTLARQQNALIEALFAGPQALGTGKVEADLADFIDLTRPAGGKHRGWLAYQAHSHHLAERALRAAFPVLAQLIGDDSFAALARALWHAHPPERGDLAQWGGALADFIQNSEQLADEPYLPDMARLEWAVHACASASDGLALGESWVLLTTHDPAELSLLLAPGTRVVASAWPINSIWQAHALTEGPQDELQSGPMPAQLEAVGQKLRTQVAEAAVVWREKFQPRVREAMPDEAAFLNALMPVDGRGPVSSRVSGQVGGWVGSLSQALDLAPRLDFNAWLPMAVHSGLLLGVEARP